MLDDGDVVVQAIRNASSMTRSIDHLLSPTTLKACSMWRAVIQSFGGNDILRLVMSIGCVLR